MWWRLWSADRLRHNIYYWTIVGHRTFSTVDSLLRSCSNYHSKTTIFDLNDSLFLWQSRIVDCSYRLSMPDLVFIVGDRRLQLTAAQYIDSQIDPSNNNDISCHLTIVGLPIFTENGSSLWILGDAFMSHYYTTFDMGKRRIGFARSVSYLGQVTSA